MKIISLVVFLFACFTISQAQIAAVYPEADEYAEELPAAVAVEAPSVEELYVSHSQLAVQTLTQYLEEQVEYPAYLAGHGIESTIYVELRLNESGTVADWSMQDDPHDPFCQALKQVLNELPALPLNGKRYLGGRQLRIPVHFHE